MRFHDAPAKSSPHKQTSNFDFYLVSFCCWFCRLFFLVFHKYLSVSEVYRFFTWCSQMWCCILNEDEKKNIWLAEIFPLYASLNGRLLTKDATCIVNEILLDRFPLTSLGSSFLRKALLFFLSFQIYRKYNWIGNKLSHMNKTRKKTHSVCPTLRSLFP